MGVATPIALYGFILAATWIDFVADHLVSLLDFMGIVLHIPGTIMGLTILAWGNSMGDLSANMTMARKGLANMAMTACFAGPIFNILTGLGLGFSSLAAQTGNPDATVALSPPIITGFVFVLVNCASILIIGIIISNGRIESYYGYVATVLYVIYIVTSITLQFSKYGDD
jgi:sodium/potassium/calcium exchanger 6